MNLATRQISFSSTLTLRSSRARSRYWAAPRYAIRLEDLCAWHRIEAAYFHCNRKRMLKLSAIVRGRPPSTRLVDLEGKLRCKRCGRLGDHVLTVGRAEQTDQPSLLRAFIPVSFASDAAARLKCLACDGWVHGKSSSAGCPATCLAFR